jgi:glycosyltransferase involved in cell wall biosynthesis
MNCQPDRLIALLSDQIEGGAAIAANRLASGLAQLGQRVERWVCNYHSGPGAPAAQTMLETSRKAPWPERLIKNFSRPIARALRRRRHERLLLDQISRRAPALLHLHNLHASGLTHESLLGLPRDLPLVWTLHDCFPVLPQAYEWFSEQGQRESTGEDPEGTSLAVSNRTRFFNARPDTVLVAPSRWIAGIARAAAAPKVRVEVIPPGLPGTEIIPGAEARWQLGLPADRPLLGFAAAKFDRRKGGDRLAAMLRQPKVPPCEVVVWGDDVKWEWASGITWHRFGLISQPRRLAQLYCACDLFICPSRIDNLPNTVLESLACGTPVLAAAVGGIPELVRPGQTGWLVEGTSVEAGAEVLRGAFAQRAVWREYRERCRALVQKEFALETCARKHLALYQGLLKM